MCVFTPCSMHVLFYTGYWHYFTTGEGVLHMDIGPWFSAKGKASPLYNAMESASVAILRGYFIVCIRFRVLCTSIIVMVLLKASQ